MLKQPRSSAHIYNSVKGYSEVKISTQNDFIYGELGRTTLHTQRLVNIIKYWLRIMNMPERKYVKIIYSMMLDDINVRPNKPNWASLVRNLLNELGFGFAWIAQGVGDTDHVYEYY